MILFKLKQPLAKLGLLKTFAWMFILSLISLDSQAQHFNFSQYNYTPLRINPALVATDNEAYVILNYRSQGTSAYSRFNTSMIALTYPLMSRKTKKTWGGVGISALDDRVSEGGMYTSQNIAANFAYNIILSSHQMISLGIQGDYHLTSITAAGMTTGSQFVGSRGFDPTASLGEDLADWKSSRFSVSTGAYWYQLDEHDRKKAYLGLAFRDLNQPNEAFKSQNSAFPSTLLAHAGVRVYESGRAMVTPELLFTRSASINLLNVGATFSYGLDDKPSASSSRLDMAARYVVGKTAVLSVQFVQKNYVIGFSYDLPINQSITSSALQGGPELVLALKKTIEPGTKKLKKKKHKKHKKKKSKKKKSGRKATASKKVTPQQTEKEPLEKGKPEAPVVKKSPEPAQNLPSVVPPVKDQPVIAKEPAPVEKDTAQQKKAVLAKLINHQFEFNFNRTELSEGTKRYLDELAVFMTENPDFQLTVTGHTDNVGSARSNQGLSEQRAESVVQYLASKGIAASRMQAVGRGFDSPMVPNDTPENRTRNRRVEFDLYLK